MATSISSRCRPSVRWGAPWMCVWNWSVGLVARTSNASPTPATPPWPSMSVRELATGRWMGLRGPRCRSRSTASAGWWTCWPGTKPSRSLLVIELKTEIVDVGESLATLDRKVRLAHVIARDIGSGAAHRVVLAGGRSRRHEPTPGQRAPRRLPGGPAGRGAPPARLAAAAGRRDPGPDLRRRHTPGERSRGLCHGTSSHGPTPRLSDRRRSTTTPLPKGPAPPSLPIRFVPTSPRCASKTPRRRRPAAPRPHAA